MCPDAVLGPVLRVSPTLATSEYPDVAWNGTHAAVVWVDDTGTRQHIYLAILNSDGTRAVATDTHVDVPGAYFRPAPASPSVVWTGAEWGVAYIETTRTSQRNFDLALRRFAPMGTPLALPVPVGSLLPVAARQAWDVELSWSSAGTYAVAFRSAGTLYFKNLGLRGMRGGAPVVIATPSMATGGISDVSLAADATGGYGILYSTSPSTAGVDYVWLAQVDAAETPSVPLNLGTPLQGGNLIHDGTTWVAAYWRANFWPDGVVARGLSLGAITVVDEPASRFGGSENHTVVRQGRAAVAFWGRSADIFASRLELPAGAATLPVVDVGSPQPLTSMGTAHLSRGFVATYTTPGRLLLVWTDWRDVRNQIYARVADYAACP